MLNSLLSRYWLLLPILILVVAVVDQFETPVLIELEETIDMRETRSDYYLAEFTTRRFQADGQLEFTVKGDTLAHFPDDNHSEIEAPRIELNRADATWNIQSMNGRFDADIDLFTLKNDVVLVRQREGEDPVTIKTQSLTIATDSNVLTTHEPIEIISANWKMNAVGMTSSIDDGKLTLLSGVTGRYDIVQDQ